MPLLNNYSLSAPAISPVWTAPTGITDVQVNMTIVCPTTTTDSLILSIDRSQDRGVTTP